MGTRQTLGASLLSLGMWALPAQAQNLPTHSNPYLVDYHYSGKCDLTTFRMDGEVTGTLHDDAIDLGFQVRVPSDPLEKMTIRETNAIDVPPEIRQAYHNAIIKTVVEDVVNGFDRGCALLEMKAAAKDATKGIAHPAPPDGFMMKRQLLKDSPIHLPPAI